MTREELKALGLSDELVESIMTAHGKSVAAEVLKTTTANTTITDLQAQLKKRDDDIKELQTKSGGNEDLQVQLASLQQKYEDDTKALEAKLADQKLDAALDAAIHGAKGRNPKAIKALLNREALKLTDDGKLEGLDLEALKASDAYLFEIEKKKDEGSGVQGGSLDPKGAISQEQFNQNINNVAWMQANIDAVTTGLANGSLTKG